MNTLCDVSGVYGRKPAEVGEQNPRIFRPGRLQQNVEVESVWEKFLLVGLGLRDGLFWKLSKFFFPDV